MGHTYKQHSMPEGQAEAMPNSEKIKPIPLIIACLKALVSQLVKKSTI